MSLRNRFRSVFSLASLGLAAFIVFWLTTERTHILQEKQDKVKSLVETAYSVLSACYQMQQHGMSQAEAQKQAIALLKNLRYENNNYFWINDRHPYMVMHPTRPLLDGTDLTGFQDPNGKALFEEMADTVRRSGEGFVTYEWPRPGADKPVPKLSFVKGFEPWGWIVGTGIYTDDVDAIWRRRALQAAVMLVALLGLLAGVATSVYHRMLGPLDRMVACMKDAAEGEGDLTRRLDLPPDREVAELARWFNIFMEKLQATLISVAGNIQHLAAAGEEISATSRQQTQGAARQKDQTQQVATVTQEMSGTVQRVMEISNRTAEAAQKAAEAARRGGKVVEETLARMQSISTSTRDAASKIEHLGQQSEHIGRIVGVIDDIADQTNLLALNAAIEAARAGTQGRGFAVVADEVRKLAERTTIATKEIAQMIHGVQEGTHSAVVAMQSGTEEVDLGVASTRQAGDSLQEIIKISDQVGEMVTYIAAAATEQARATDDMHGNIEQIASIAATTAVGAHQTAKATEDLAALAAEIQKQVGQFRLESVDSAAAPQSRYRAAAGGR